MNQGALNTFTQELSKVWGPLSSSLTFQAKSLTQDLIRNLPYSPTELLEMSDRLKKGDVLCLAEGEGRNAVYLARQGFAATAVDSSRVGLAKADKLAQEFGVTIQTVLADLADYTIEEGVWDSIVSISCHVHQDLRRRLHRDVVAGLKEGGTFLLEAYTPKQLEFGTGGPPSAEYSDGFSNTKKGA